MNHKFPKLVDTPHYHLWTDALHARELARQTNNRWDRGTYVRWTITTSWTAFEIACEDAVNAKGIGYRFKDNLDKAVSALGLPKLDWGAGVWHRVSQVHQLRKSYVHPGIPQEQLFPEVTEADTAIETLRNAITAIYLHAGKTPPDWLRDNEDRGWDNGKGGGANTVLIHAGANEQDPEAIKIAYDYKGREYISDVLPPGTDASPHIEELIRNANVPISAVRAYRGQTVIVERQLPMRGT